MTDKKIEQSIGSCPKFIVSEKQTSTMLLSPEGAWVHIQDVCALLRKLPPKPVCETCGGSEIIFICSKCGRIKPFGNDNWWKFSNKYWQHCCYSGTGVYHKAQKGKCPACSQPPTEEARPDIVLGIPPNREKGDEMVRKALAKPDLSTRTPLNGPTAKPPITLHDIQSHPDEDVWNKELKGHTRDCSFTLEQGGSPCTCGYRKAPKPETTLTPSTNKCTLCFEHPLLKARCKHCGGTGKEPKAEEFVRKDSIDYTDDRSMRVYTDACHAEIERLNAQLADATKTIEELKGK